MRFGIYAEVQCPGNKSCAVLCDEVFRQMVHADDVAFDNRNRNCIRGGTRDISYQVAGEQSSVPAR